MVKKYVFQFEPFLKICKSINIMSNILYLPPELLQQIFEDVEDLYNIRMVSRHFYHNIIHTWRWKKFKLYRRLVKHNRFHIFRRVCWDGETCFAKKIKKNSYISPRYFVANYMIQWISSSRKSLFVEVCENGHLETARWLYRELQKDIPLICQDGSAYEKYIVTRAKGFSNELLQALEATCRKGYKKIVIWLLELLYSNVCDNNVHLNSVKKIIEKQSSDKIRREYDKLFKDFDSYSNRS